MMARIEAHPFGLYIALAPDGLWARSSEVSETITADWDAQGRLIGLEISGSTVPPIVGSIIASVKASGVSEVEVEKIAKSLKDRTSGT